jgi:hypothetical protein
MRMQVFYAVQRGRPASASVGNAHGLSWSGADKCIAHHDRQRQQTTAYTYCLVTKLPAPPISEWTSGPSQRHTHCCRSHCFACVSGANGIVGPPSLRWPTASHVHLSIGRAPGAYAMQAPSMASAGSHTSGPVWPLRCRGPVLHLRANGGASQRCHAPTAAQSASNTGVDHGRAAILPEK